MKITMASSPPLFKLFPILVLMILSAIFLHSETVLASEFEVGDGKGWAVPNSNQYFNNWASRHRFKISDTLRFKYKKDSVMVVTEEEYRRCRSSHPLFYSNNGNGGTVYSLSKPGVFYFISGVSGHCEHGMKMIVKVLDANVSASRNQNQTAALPSEKSDAVSALALPAAATIVASVAVTIMLLS